MQMRHQTEHAVELSAAAQAQNMGPTLKPSKRILRLQLIDPSHLYDLSFLSPPPTTQCCKKMHFFFLYVVKSLYRACVNVRGGLAPWFVNDVCFVCWTVVLIQESRYSGGAVRMVVTQDIAH